MASNSASHAMDARSKAGGWERQKRRQFVYGTIPAMAVLVAVTVVPAIYLLVTSFTPLDLTRAEETTLNFSRPLGNYIDLWSDNRFLDSLLRQVILSVSTVGFQLLIGLGVAVMLNSRSRFVEAVRTTFLVPMVLPPIVVAIIWKVLYTPDISPFYWLMRGLHIDFPVLITEASLALWAIVIADVWEWFPFAMLMILAALQMMPEEPLEAAKIDGAGSWQVFRHVVLPLLRPTLVVACLFRLIDSIKAFPLLFIITQGGPGTATEVTNYYGYLQAFNFSYLGYASAITVIMVAAVFLLSWGVMRIVGTEVEVE
ncbi:MAG: sugar ABC transporter permease [Dehalococcoidales bacterium]|nr:sugar ABC transporter permease [Dehalococcoidales bacterium]